MVLVCAFSGACALSQDAYTPPPAAQDFTLHSGDRLKIDVFGDEDLSGEYEIDANGAVTLPLIGRIAAAGQSPDSVQNDIAQSLRQGYINDPKVTIDIIAMRPFYILGEVQSPGDYPARADMDVFQAIASAGGLTPRAVSGDYVIYRGFAQDRIEIAAQDDTPVLPGDSIRVKKRWF